MNRFGLGFPAAPLSIHRELSCSRQKRGLDKPPVAPAKRIPWMVTGCNGNERPYLLEIAPLENVTELTALISRKSKKNRPISRNKSSEFR
jgi:hypothetical protein